MRFGVPSGTKSEAVRGSPVFPGPPVLPAPPKRPAVGRWTLMLSLGIHAFVLVSLFQAAAGIGGEDREPAVIDVDFIPPPAPEPPPAPAPPLPPSVAEPTPPPPADAPEPPPPPPPPTTTPIAAPAPEPPRPPPSKPPPVRKPRPAPEAHPTTDDRPPAVVAVTPAEPPPAASERDGLLPLHDDSLAAYGRRVWARVERRKPRDIHTSGVATVTFALAADGSLLSASLSASSGIASLDRAALATVAAAAPFPPPPPGASPAQLVFAIPFDFH